MTMSLHGKIALVTGGGQGIGKGCALALAQAGADIILNDRPGSTTLAATAVELRALGVKVHEAAADHRVDELSQVLEIDVHDAGDPQAEFSLDL
jgi:NAD(P)-dependent dehydrogenase (short-subunit alcohol dehydrogenase family)